MPIKAIRHNSIQPALFDLPMKGRVFRPAKISSFFPVYEDRTNVLYEGDCIEWLKSLADETVDLVFADPPYNLSRLTEIPSAVFDAEILKEEGILILEHPKEFDFSKHGNFVEIRKYGKVNFSFFGHKKSSSR